ncbi:MAG TPA: hypothetical protein VE954_06505 [Oligoflexus sp.]|uniref:hypothetical protein n=1 Tax=Oligoflexus sp. TaxID=1971216 RepID=UPI002D3E4FB3|nr:hypothetical protein [Oligoflexus sp.]HYX32747.1 hypothetical protein [Oligoflexus sp.]
MKKSLIFLTLVMPFALSTPMVLGADACKLSVEIDTTKTLQAALSIHQNVKREMIELQKLASGLEGSAAEVSQQILIRLGDTKENLQQAFSKLDDSQSLPLILAQAQGRLTAALGKFRGFRDLNLDEGKRGRISCVEQRLDELNQRLQDILKAPR